MRISNLIRAAIKIASQNKNELSNLSGYLVVQHQNARGSNGIVQPYYDLMSPDILFICELVNENIKKSHQTYYSTPEYSELLVECGIIASKKPNRMFDLLTGNAQKTDCSHYLNPNGLKSKFIVLQSRYVSFWMIIAIGVIVVVGSGLHSQDGFAAPAILFIMFVAALAKYYLDAFKYPAGCDYLNEVILKIENPQLKNTLKAFIDLNRGLSQNDLLRITDAIRSEHFRVNGLINYFKRKEAPQIIIDALTQTKDQITLDLGVIEEMIFMSGEDRTLYY